MKRKRPCRGKLGARAFRVKLILRAEDFGCRVFSTYSLCSFFFPWGFIGSKKERNEGSRVVREMRFRVQDLRFL